MSELPRANPRQQPSLGEEPDEIEGQLAALRQAQGKRAASSWQWRMVGIGQKIEIRGQKKLVAHKENFKSFKSYNE